MAMEVTILKNFNGVATASGFYLGTYYKHQYIGHSDEYIKDHFRKWVKDQHLAPV